MATDTVGPPGRGDVGESVTRPALFGDLGVQPGFVNLQAGLDAAMQRGCGRRT